MTEQERLILIREFLNSDLAGTELKLKSHILELNNKLSEAQASRKQLAEQLQKAQLAANNKQMEVVALSERLDGLCDLVIELQQPSQPDIEQVTS